jgi:hypothetical protein
MTMVTRDGRDFATGLRKVREASTDADRGDVKSGASFRRVRVQRDDERFAKELASIEAAAAKRLRAHRGTRGRTRVSRTQPATSRRSAIDP